MGKDNKKPKTTQNSSHTQNKQTGRTGEASDEEIAMMGASPEKIAQRQKKEKRTTQDKDSQEEAVRSQAEEKGLGYVDLRDFDINQEVLSLVPKDTALKLRAVPYLKTGSQVRVATDQLTLIEEEEKRINQMLEKKELTAQVVLASKKSLDNALKQLKDIEQKDKGQEKKVVLKKQEGIGSLDKLKRKIREIPTTELLQTLLSGAVNNRASDIHLVPLDSKARIRYRIDGVLQDITKVPLESYKKLLHRIKYHAKIKMNIHSRPQDGRFETEAGDKKMDIRVSTFPSINGETVVMRLLEENKEFFELEELGFNNEVLGKVKETISKPNGMILNTGPTGSGKTTTLYAVLDDVNRPQVKIITLEDPVEYHLQGITQTQIDPDHEFTFASGLKHVLRQDPDILMVGEVRSKETATTALHAALTGHLVLSTLHTNDASSAFVRLLDMGVKPYFLIGSLNLVMAQRLVRKLCSECKKEYQPKKEEVKNLKKLSQKQNLEIDKLYRAGSCSKCNGTGYQGRTAIAEAIIPNKKLERVVLKKPTQYEIEEVAKKQKMTTMAQDGVEKVITGTTSLQELLRVVA